MKSILFVHLFNKYLFRIYYMLDRKQNSPDFSSYGIYIQKEAE